MARRCEEEERQLASAVRRKEVELAWVTTAHNRHQQRKGGVAGGPLVEAACGGQRRGQNAQGRGTCTRQPPRARGPRRASHREARTPANGTLTVSTQCKGAWRGSTRRS